MSTQVQWSKPAKDGVEIPFNGVPFFVLGGKYYQCHRGHDKDARLKERQREARKIKTVFNLSNAMYITCTYSKIV